MSRYARAVFLAVAGAAALAGCAPTPYEYVDMPLDNADYPCNGVVPEMCPYDLQ